MTNNLQQLDKNGEIFLKFFGAVSPYPCSAAKPAVRCYSAARPQHKLQRGIRFHPAARGQRIRCHPTLAGFSPH